MRILPTIHNRVRPSCISAGITGIPITMAVILLTILIIITPIRPLASGSADSVVDSTVDTVEDFMAGSTEDTVEVFMAVAGFMAVAVTAEFRPFNFLNLMS